jgi:lipopolysaccharide exporter
LAWRELFGFSFWVWAQSIVSVLRDRSDPVIIGRFMDPAAVGTFSVGTEIAWLPSSELVEPIARSLFPGFSASLRAGTGLADAYLRAMAVIATMVLPVCIGMSLLADPVVRLMLGAKWLGAIPIVQIVSVMGVGTVISHVAWSMLGVLGNTRMQFILTVVGALIRLPLLAYLVWRHDLLGAASAVFISGLADISLMSVVTARSLQVNIAAHARVLARPLFATALMVLGLISVGLGWVPVVADQWELILNIAMTGVLGAAIYVLALLGAWWLIGRPPGAERFLLDISFGILRRVVGFFG